jgi:hypothetical protein
LFLSNQDLLYFVLSFCMTAVAYAVKAGVVMDTSRLTPSQRATRLGLANTLVCAYVALTVTLVLTYGREVAADGTLALSAVLSVVVAGTTTRPPRSNSTTSQWFSHEYGKYVAANLVVVLIQVINLTVSSCLQREETLHQATVLLILNFSLGCSAKLRFRFFP